MPGDPQPSETNFGDRSDERERLLAAITRVAGEQGYFNLTVEDVVRYAGVAEDTFFDHFASTEEGLMAAFDSFLDRLWQEVCPVCEADVEWPQKVRAALDVTLTYLAEAASVARVFALEAAANLAVTERQFAAMERYAAMLRDGRRHYPRGAELPAQTERAIVGGIASIVSRHLLAEDPQALSALEPELTQLVLMPYLGSAEAERIAFE